MNDGAKIRFTKVPEPKHRCIIQYEAHAGDAFLGYVELRNTSVWRSRRGSVQVIRWAARLPSGQTLDQAAGIHKGMPRNFGTRAAAGDALRTSQGR